MLFVVNKSRFQRMISIVRDDKPPKKKVPFLRIAKELCILLDISRDFEGQIRIAGFEICFINNFQGRAGWLTGWRVPHATENIEAVLKWLCAAFRTQHE
jgi:hypothetical protein